MKTPDENKCGLECIRTNVKRVCVKPKKGQCPRCEQLIGEANERIQQLEAQLADAKLNHQHTIDIAEKQREQIGKLKKVIVRISIEKKGLESIIRGFPEVCQYCKNNDGEFCKGNPDAWGTCFEWIGIPSRTEAQPDA